MAQNIYMNAGRGLLARPKIDAQEETEEEAYLCR